MAKEPDGEWAEVKRRCRLSADDVKMARALGLQPRSLIKNIPGPREAWKAPVRDWVRELYRKRFGTIVRAEQRPSPRWERPAEPPVAEFGDDPWLQIENDILGGPERSVDQEAEEDNRYRARRHEQFRAAAEYVAATLGRLEEVQRVVLFGSVAAPLRKAPGSAGSAAPASSCGTTARTSTSPSGRAASARSRHCRKRAAARSPISIATPGSASRIIRTTSS
jgi:hypothetical protein